MKVGIGNEPSNGFVSVRREDVARTLKEMHGVYSASSLEKAQNISYVLPGNMELSVKTFNEFTVVPAHQHPEGREYMYVISGNVQYMDVAAKEVYEYGTGDFYVINRERHTHRRHRLAPGSW